MTYRRALLMATLAAALGGCVTLVPKAQPDQLYRLAGPPGAAAENATAARFGVLDDTIDFAREAATDRILTVDGDQVAYISGGRWATSAPIMFREALQRGFDAGGPARLIERGQTAQAEYVLKLEVRRFEAIYDHGAGTAPRVVVRVVGSLSKYSDRSPVADREFVASVPASENRLGAIAQAFDQATSQVVGQIVTWVGQSGT